MSIEPDIENLGELPRVPGVPGVFRLPDGSVVSEDYVLLARIASALERIAGALEGKNTWKEWAGKAQPPKKSIWPQVLAKFTAEELEAEDFNYDPCPRCLGTKIVRWLGITMPCPECQP